MTQPLSPLLAAACLCIAGVDAQCSLTSLTATGYGSFCPSSPAPRFASVQFDPIQCQVDILMLMSSHVFAGPPVAGWIAFSYSPQQHVYPELGGCARMSSPIALAWVSSNGQLTVPVPPSFPPVTFYIDGAGLWVSSVFGPYVMPVYGGMQLSLQ